MVCLEPNYGELWDWNWSSKHTLNVYYTGSLYVKWICFVGGFT